MFDIQVDRVRLSKNKKTILNEVSCSIPSGALTVFLGANGAGKSSLLRCLVGLESPQSGQIFLRGRVLHSYTQKERTQIVSWCPADTQVAYPYSCLELVCMGRFAKHCGYIQSSDYKIARSAMEKLGLEAIMERSSHELSSGEFRKLMIAQALASENRVLVFDEPEAHLDLAYVFEVLGLFKRLSREGYTVCISMHRLELAAEYADHVVLLKEGRVIGEGSDVDLFTEEHIYQGFGVRLSTVITAQGEKKIFHPFSQNLS
jgi:iron complex transport system ATP-binding protein